MSARLSHMVEMLRSFVERIERIDEGIKNLRTDRADVRAEAKTAGFSLAVLDEVLKRRRTEDPAFWENFDITLVTYMEAVGFGGNALDALMDQAREAKMIAGGSGGARGAAKPSAKDRALAEALAWARGPVN